MRSKLAVIAVTLAGLATAPGSAHALDLGLTPSHVFSLWTNINNGLIAATRIVSDDALTETVAAMRPKSFAGKVPGDVLERARAVRDKLDSLRRDLGLKKTVLFDSNDGRITPSDVYLNSGHVLDGLVGWLIHGTGPELLASRFYVRHKFSSKTPSDVFGLVDLANRRLETILHRAGS